MKKLIGEIAIHKILEHKNVVRLNTSFFDDNEHLHIVLDYCESSIQHYLDSGKQIIDNSFYTSMLLIDIT
jgi:hypothetical protein